MSRSSLAAPCLAALALVSLPLSAQDLPRLPQDHPWYPEVQFDSVDRAPSPPHHAELLSDPFPVPLDAVTPLGGFVYQGSVDGTLALTAGADDFEGGALGPAWTTFSSLPEGRIQVTDMQGAASGQFAVLMDTSVNGPNVLNEIIWTVDLTGFTQAVLQFSHAEWGDETNNFSGPFVDHFDADGVAISADGTNWFPVMDMPNQATGVWETYEIDLAAAAAAASITLGPGFQIKFQQFDNFQLTTDGRGWDAVSILAPGIDTDEFSFEVDPGQQITLLVAPEPGVQPVVTLRRGNNVLGTATAPAPGAEALLQTITGTGNLTGFGGTAQTYTAAVTSTTTAIGNYQLSVLLNTALEAENHGGPANDSIATAQDLSPSFLPLHSAAPSSPSGPKPDRAGVVGALGSSELDSDDFESGALGAQWTTFSSDPMGRILVSSAQGTAAGMFAVLMDRDPSGSNTLNEMVWTVDLSGIQQATLVFWHAEWGDETHDFAGPFVDHFDADGVAISADGTNWFPVMDMPNQATGVWERYEIDLAAAAAAANIPLGAGFQVKFQQFDNFPIATDGRGWDEIGIVTSTADWYCIPLEAGETLTVAATALTGAAVEVDLVDASGNVVAGGSGSAIENGSFETGDFSGWTTVETNTPFRPWQVTGGGMGGGFGLAVTEPQEGSNVAWNGFDGNGPMEFTMHQDVAIGGAATGLRWQDRAQWNFTLGGPANLPRLYDVEIRDPMSNALIDTLFSFSTGTQATNPTGDTGWMQHSADLSGYVGQTVRLVFRARIPESGTGPGQLEIDDVGFATALNTDALVRNFGTTGRGTYYVRVRGTNTDYGLLVHRNSDLNIEDNDSIATADPVATRRVMGRMWLSGHVDDGAGDGSDYYQVSVSPGRTLRVTTFTPGDGVGVFQNDLDPLVRLYDASGMLLAEDDNSAGDTHNADLSHTVPKGGSEQILFVEVLASPATAPTSGPYVVAFQGNN